MERSVWQYSRGWIGNKGEMEWVESKTTGNLLDIKFNHLNFDALSSFQKQVCIYSSAPHRILLARRMNFLLVSKLNWRCIPPMSTVCSSPQTNSLAVSIIWRRDCHIMWWYPGEGEELDCNWKSSCACCICMCKLQTLTCYREYSNALNITREASI